MIIALLLALFTLLSLLMAPGRAWDNLTFADRNALVFQHRHRDYGAYRLRRSYGHHLAAGLLATFLLLALVAGGAKWLVASMPVPPPVDKATSIDDELSRVFIVPPAPPAGPKTETVAPPIERKAPDDQEAPKLVEAGDDDAIPEPPVVDTTSVSPLDGPDGADPGGGTGTAGSVGQGGTGGDGPDGSSGGWGTKVHEGFEVQELPEFPGGEAGLARWVDRNLDFPPVREGHEMIFVQFTIMPDGSVKDVQAVKGRTKAYREAAERALRRMPHWKPARMNGQVVPCRLTLPIHFETR